MRWGLGGVALAGVVLVLATIQAGCDRAEPGVATRGAFLAPAEPAGTAAGAVPDTRVATVRWDAVAPWRQRRGQHAPEPAPASGAAAWQRVQLPVLAPRSALEAGVATGEAHWYALSARVDGGTLYIGGGTIETVLEAYAAHDERSPIERPRATVNLAVPEVAWSAFGAHYSMSFECARPAEDPRCADTAFVEQLLHEVVVIDTPALRAASGDRSTR